MAVFSESFRLFTVCTYQAVVSLQAIGAGVA